MGFLRIKYLFVFLFYISLTCSMQAKDSLEYERNSLHVMMLKHKNQRFDEIIEDVFLKSPFPERFNDHNLGVKSVAFAELDGDQSDNIMSFIERVNLGKKMVAKWFDRNKKTGSFDMQLIKERGCYNATQSKINQARASIRGLALIEDAGENLIHQTYLLVNDISYKSKGNGGWFLKTIGSAYFGNVESMQNALESIGGFRVNIKSYLFRLVWNDDVAQTFYTQYYTENGIEDADKVKAFEQENRLFRMEYVGMTESTSSETRFTASKNPQALLMKVCTQALDLNIAQLQHQYNDFRIKAPLISTEPLKADVGVKEDITENSRFEVLERLLGEDGKVSYERVGIIKPVKGRIRDNRYMVTSDESKEAAYDATEFEKVSGKDFQRGMLIREIR